MIETEAKSLVEQGFAVFSGVEEIDEVIHYLGSDVICRRTCRF
jgi:hypothetical protein